MVASVPLRHPHDAASLVPVTQRPRIGSAADPSKDAEEELVREAQSAVSFIQQTQELTLSLMAENRRLTEENNRLTEDTSQKEQKIHWLTSKLEKLQKKLPDTEKQLWDTKQQLVQLEHKYRLLQGKLPAIAAGVVSADELQEEQL
jgi:chromosome segregation ATPase